MSAQHPKRDSTNGGLVLLAFLYVGGGLLATVGLTRTITTNDLFIFGCFSMAVLLLSIRTMRHG